MKMSINQSGKKRAPTFMLGSASLLFGRLVRVEKPEPAAGIIGRHRRR